MLKKAQVEAEEEAIRRQVRDLPDDQRLAFFQACKDQLKDPDTYAVLNWIFIAGLHHFYLGRWLYGLINICIFWAGVLLLFLGLPWLGGFLVIGITLWEAYELFRSQIIVAQHNNCLMRRLYQQITGTSLI
ncbi:TM2 domain-containing protein [Marinospirillum perlucidum]|uniref:TM2 domain-containing protein n=1 Tax=Marinospirillum perlucidum TaxID=1982602 RepID=UPI000DF252B4|nr:TM2 domain-containing protein [Marinospirillum perlucidum]